MPADDLRRSVLAVVRRIPRGRVATYGQVAALAGRPGAARAVGRVLREEPAAARLPWHRVLASPGRIAPALWRTGSGAEQGRRLRREGVSVDERGRVDLARDGWRARLTLRRRAVRTGGSPRAQGSPGRAGPRRGGDRAG